MDAKLSSVLKASPDVSVEQQKDMTDRVKTEIYQRAREGAIREIIETVKAEAIRAGATEESISVVEKEDIALTYIPGSATRIKVKVVGDMKAEESCEDCPITVVIDHTAEEAAAGIQTSNKTVSTTGTMLSYDDETIRIQEPEINTETGEWLLSTYDLECLSVGAGVMGCGGGGNPRLGLLLARKVLESGNTIRVVTPERFLCSAVHADDKVAMVAVMGAPLIAHEKLMAGNELEGALQSMLELYENGNYNDADGDLHVTDDTDVKVGDGVVYIDNYPPKTRVGRSCLAAVMSCEVGGLNCMEPLRVAAELGVPVLDCDGMGRAFPELQMFTPFIYGFKPYPATMADDKGRRAVVLKVDSPNRLEKHFRDVTISMGCSSGVCFAAMRVQDVTKYTVRHSLSQAWRIGDTVLRARASDGDPVAAVIEAEAGRNLIYGKVTDVLRETTGGFNIGKIDIDGLDVDTGRRITVQFKNEFIVVREMSCSQRRVLASVPDLIALLDADTAQPIPTEEVGFGMRVAVVGFRVNPMMSSDEALKLVGPKAFGLTDVEYVPIGEFKDRGSIAPL
ncbi:uncharacterized protein LOC127846524 [Dreissena polymorpha]|nr:uncharacterized protein LOC127846524 [Dreissena polymorpha]